MSVPQELLDLLTTAQTDLDAAVSADVAYEGSVEELNMAIDEEEEAKESALAAHRKSSESANFALDALKKHFGIGQ